MIAPAASTRTAAGTSIGKAHPLRAGEPLDPVVFEKVRRHMLLRCSKWDPQVGDVATLARFPLLISSSDWNDLRRLSEQLTIELLAAEDELLDRPDLHKSLAIPAALRNLLRLGRAVGMTPAAARVMRFDFHWTTDGWRISEVNSDVPGGFAESSDFPSLVAELVSSGTPAGDPAAALVDSIARSVASETGPVGLLAAVGFMEDLQVVSYLRDRLRAKGIEAAIISPRELSFQNGRPCSGSGRTRLSALVRFFQIEWFAHLPREQRKQWSPLFTGGSTPVTNPAQCVFSESKRFSLVWDALSSRMTTWRRLLPETRDPRDAPWRIDDGWLLKSAFCNTGDSVSIRALLPPRQWRQAVWSATWSPGRWIAQRRFETLPVSTPTADGDEARPLYPCVGVYTIEGACAGAYARLSSTPVVNFEAVDAALLVEREERR